MGFCGIHGESPLRSLDLLGSPRYREEVKIVASRFRRLALFALPWALAASAACGTSNGDPASTDPGSAKDGGSPRPDSSTGTPSVTPPSSLPEAGLDASVDGAVPKGPPPISLPVSYLRPDEGNALSAAELTTATDELLAILKDTHYFDFVDERIHGWPETDPNKGFWWGVFWSGITATKTGGKVTYKHSNDGADNPGIHTSPYLEGACYAHLLWGEPKTAHLVRRITRGMSAWILAMQKQAGDTNPTLLARAFYPPSVDSSEGGRSLHIDYDLSRPGIDNDPSDYVHIPNNPTFGDIYVKNKRSKDDIGHMLRAIVQSQTCAPRLSSDGQSDLAQTMSLYTSWAKVVDGAGFTIATLDKSLNLWTPPIYPYGFAHYVLAGDLECPAAFAIRLMGGSAPGSLGCGQGISQAERLGLGLMKNDARQIVRTHHAAATTLSFVRNEPTLGLELLKGLAERVQIDLGLAQSASPPAGFSIRDVTSLMIYAANVGVPLTSKEVRWLHTQLHEAYVGMRDPAQAATFRLFDASTPDGLYSYDPPNIGLFYKDLAMMLGSCASPYRNPNARPVLDCARLQSQW